MYKHLVTTVFLITTTTACVIQANPDEGKLARYLCYQVDVLGDPSSRNDYFSIIVTQDNLDVHDAANFVPGNKLASEFGTKQIPFTVQVYKNADSLSSKQDPKTYALDLLSKRADITYQGLGSRMMNIFSVYWDYEEGYVYFKAEDSDGSAIVGEDPVTSQIEHRNIWCEDPWGISVS